MNKYFVKKFTGLYKLVDWAFSYNKLNYFKC